MSDEHVHQWERVGRCVHPHASGLNEHALSACDGCQRFGHSSRPISYVCGVTRKGPVPPADCPVGKTFDAETYPIERLVRAQGAARHQADVDAAVARARAKQSE